MTFFPRSNRGAIAQGLNKFLGILGKPPSFAIGDLVQPNFDLVGARAYPFQNFAIPCFGTQNVAAVALEFGYAFVGPGLNSCLEVRKVSITNLAAVVRYYKLKYVSAGNQATIGTANVLHLLAGTLTDFDITWPERRSGFYFQGTHTAELGSDIKEYAVEPGSTRDIVLAAPIFLWNQAGKPTGGANGPQSSLAVFHETINETLIVDFECVDWPIP